MIRSAGITFHAAHLSGFHSSEEFFPVASHRQLVSITTYPEALTVRDIVQHDPFVIYEESDEWAFRLGIAKRGQERMIRPGDEFSLEVNDGAVSYRLWIRCIEPMEITDPLARLATVKCELLRVNA